MKSYLKLLLLFVTSVSITIVFSPIIASLVPFHLYRIMSRMILIVSFILFYYFRERFGIQSIKSLGYDRSLKWTGLCAVGYLFAVLSMGTIMVFMLKTNIRFVVDDILPTWFVKVSGYVFAGLLVAVIEECFFRGFIFQSLLKDTSLAISLIITNLFYSLVHFMRPVEYGEMGILNLTSSLKAVPLFFIPIYANFVNILPELIGLFLVGLVLSFAYIRTKSLAMSIGLHASWILGIKSISLFTDSTRIGSFWMNGTVVAQPFTWVVLIAIIFLLNHRFMRKRLV